MHPQASTRSVVLGLWPLAGVTTIGVTRQRAMATLHHAISLGVRHFDSAFSYGYEGESDQMLGQLLRETGLQNEAFIIGKVGQRWDEPGKRVIDGSPEQLTQDAETSLKRLGREYFDVLMLHSPDPQVELEVSAEAIAHLQRRGLAREIGVCNVDPTQLEVFSRVVHPAAIQCPLNMLQTNALESLIPACSEQKTQVYVFWTLMKGLLAGKITRDHVFAPGDSRPGYDIYQGAQRETAHRILDDLQQVALESDRTMPELAIGWTVSQPGVTAALVGAHRPEQLEGFMNASPLEADVLAKVNRILQFHQNTT